MYTLQYQLSKALSIVENENDVIVIMIGPYFNKDIFYLHNRNHTSRVRDAKRTTYMEFLKWVETYEETGIQLVNKNMTKEDHLHQTLFTQISGFEGIYNSVQKEWEEAKEYKRKFNGHLVREWTGLDGNELGEFMRDFLEYHGSEWKASVIESSEEDVQEEVMDFYWK